MAKKLICTIGATNYFISQDIDKNKFILWDNSTPIAVIVRKELVNWKGPQVRFRPFSAPAELDYLDENALFALDEALLYLSENYGA